MVTPYVLFWNSEGVLPLLKTDLKQKNLSESGERASHQEEFSPSRSRTRLRWSNRHVCNCRCGGRIATALLLALSFCEFLICSCRLGVHISRVAWTFSARLLSWANLEVHSFESRFFSPAHLHASRTAIFAEGRCWSGCCCSGMKMFQW